jgi:hypothetical protein
MALANRKIIDLISVSVKLSSIPSFLNKGSFQLKEVLL